MFYIAGYCGDIIVCFLLFRQACRTWRYTAILVFPLCNFNFQVSFLVDKVWASNKHI